jgi:outer membrane receptor protein involved in Fe transport
LPGLPGFDLFSASNFSEQTRFSQELRLVGSGKQLHWVVGAFYLDVDRRAQNGAGSGLYLNGAGSAGPAFEARSGEESYAVFGDIAYDFTEQLTLTLGTRYFEDEQFSSTLGKVAFDKVSSKVSLSYTVADNASVYASASQGFRSGGFNRPGTPAYGSEEVNGFELGYKASLLEGRLNAEAALYFSQYDDYIMQTIDPLVSPSPFNANGGEAEIQGFEFATQFQATESLSLGLSGNVTETEFVTVTSPVVHVGDPISNSPKYSYTAHADYSFDWSADTAGFAYLSYSRQGSSSAINRETWGELESSDLGFVSANLGAQWQDFTLTLSGNNLTNEQRSTTANKVSRLGIEARRPRTLSLSASYQF